MERLPALTSPEWNGKEDIISSVMETQYQLWTRRAYDEAIRAAICRMVYLPKPTYELGFKPMRPWRRVNGDTLPAYA